MSDVIDERAINYRILKHFNERQIKEIEFCLFYVSEFNHGTDGHNIRVIVAELVKLLNEKEVLAK